MHITAMVHININCRNFEVFRAFYEMLGFKVYGRCRQLIQRR
jgi:predicted lactoylglutathione lyase